MNASHWSHDNLSAIQARLAFLGRLPDGLIHARPGTLHDLVIVKKGTFLEMHFHGGRGREVISDLDFANPLFLVAGFTQAMMLGLLWADEPRQVYVLGFGAGRVPMVLHHHFPSVVVESTDIDPDVVDAAGKFFGIRTDDRLKVVVQDGREYLAGRPPAEKYDIIMSDAFRGIGSSPYPVGTRQFYELCQEHLTESGVVVVNLMRSDFLFHEKIKTLKSCFPTAYGVPIPQDGTIVLFGTNQPLCASQQLIDRATVIQAQRQFCSPFVEHARRLQPLSEVAELATGLAGADILDDDAPPRPFPWPKHVSDRIGRNDPCPCGSGKKYKKCHGSA